MYYVGIDHHKKTNAVTVMDKEGTILKRARLSNDKGDLNFFFHSLEEPCSVVFESSRDWSVLYDNLENLVSDVHLANPYKIRVIAEAKIKTDKIDSEILAHLLRSNMIPESHIPSREVRYIRYLLRQRLFFVKLRTMAKNRVHHLIDRNHYGPIVSDAFTDLFGKKGMAFLKEVELPESERLLLNELLCLLEELNRLVEEDDKRIKKLFGEDERVAMISEIPGLGHLFSALAVYEIDRIERFPSPKKLHSYAGLVPSTHASGGKSYHGRLIRSGNHYLKWAMVEAVWPAIRHDPSLRLYFNRIKAKNGKNAAKIAVARRLLTIVYHILKDKRPYYQGKVVRDQERSRVVLT